MAGFLDAAYQILKENGRPMHGKEIVRQARERKMFTSRSKTNDDWQLIRSITSDIKRGGNRRGMTILGRGYYGLLEWEDTGNRSSQANQGQHQQPPPPLSSLLKQVSISLEMLERTRQAMPADEFRQVWGSLYEQLLAEARARAITPLDDKDLAKRARSVLRRIHAFLLHDTEETPTSEDICDWIVFCYALELCREVAALWQYVKRDEVDWWQYQRTERIVTLCQRKT